MLGIVSKGIIIGVLVSAPMGPVGMLCIQRTLNKGRWHGFATGMGATLSDVIYAALTCLGMGVVVNFVEAHQAPLQLIGSVVLGFFGYYIFQMFKNICGNFQGGKRYVVIKVYIPKFHL